MFGMLMKVTCLYSWLRHTSWCEEELGYYYPVEPGIPRYWSLSTVICGLSGPNI